jgi:pimeloyl-ACP methyl ester carboxylesterase
MYLLSTPDLANRLTGLVLISTAPNASWLPAFIAMTEQNPLPAVATATAVYEADPTNDNLAAIAVASAAWNFGPHTIDAGRDLLGRMPYNEPAVAWSDEHFDRTYRAAWIPEVVPTLIISGSDDRIVAQALWNDDRYRQGPITRAIIKGGAHFPWIENPAGVKDALQTFASKLASSNTQSTPGAMDQRYWD